MSAVRAPWTCPACGVGCAPHVDFCGNCAAMKLLPRPWTNPAPPLVMCDDCARSTSGTCPLHTVRSITFTPSIFSVDGEARSHIGVMLDDCMIHPAARGLS